MSDPNDEEQHERGRRIDRAIKQLSANAGPMVMVFADVTPGGLEYLRVEPIGMARPVAMAMLKYASDAGLFAEDATAQDGDENESTQET